MDLEFLELRSHFANVEINLVRSNITCSISKKSQMNKLSNWTRTKIQQGVWRAHNPKEGAKDLRVKVVKVCTVSYDPMYKIRV